MTQITISLPQDLIITGKIHAKNTGKTFSGIIRVGLEKELLEDKGE